MERKKAVVFLVAVKKDKNGGIFVVDSAIDLVYYTRLQPPVSERNQSFVKLTFV
jgi:hypothetical protein